MVWVQLQAMEIAKRVHKVFPVFRSVTASFVCDVKRKCSHCCYSLAHGQTLLASCLAFHSQPVYEKKKEGNSLKQNVNNIPEANGFCKINDIIFLDPVLRLLILSFYIKKSML